MQALPGTLPLSPEALAAFGAGLAYVRPVVHQGRPAYAICSADGAQLAVAASREIAFGLVRQNDMEPVDAH